VNKDKWLVFGAYVFGIIFGIIYALLALRWIFACDPCSLTVCGTTEFGIFRDPIIFECAIKRFAIASIPVLVFMAKKERDDYD